MSRGWSILAVASLDSKVCSWAEQRSVEVCPVEALPPADYLFSIANHRILPGPIVRRPGRLAINLHDGPLPRYAGLNATTWALLRGETEHAISWHKMVERADAGEILLQARVALHPGETSASLNLECQRVVLESLPVLLVRLEGGDTSGTPQDLSQRTYFSSTQRPCPVLDLSQSSPSLDALVRAHDFGPFPNPFGLIKLWTGEQFYWVRNLQAGPCQPVEPGRVLRWRPPSILEVCCGDAVLSLEIGLWSGSPPPSAELDSLVGRTLPPFPAEMASELACLSEAALKKEASWVSWLENQALQRLACEGDGPAGSLELPLNLSVGEAVQKFLQWLALAHEPGVMGWATSLRPAARLEGLFCQATPHLLGQPPPTEAAGPMSRDLFWRYPTLASLRRSMPEFRWPLVVSLGLPVTEPEAATVQVCFWQGRCLWRWGKGLRVGPLQSQARSFQRFLTHSAQPGLYARWQQQARRSPQAEALRWAGKSLSYEELRQRSERLAGLLIRSGVREEEPVAVLAEPSASMVVGWLGVLAAGATCVPVDAGGSPERAASLLQQVGVRRLLWDGRGAPLEGLETFDLNAPSPEEREELPEVSLQASAFLLFTSGSSGQPKAVTLTHEAPKAFEWGPCPLSAGDVCCLWSRPTVVDALWQILAPLLRGLPVVLLPDSVTKDPAQFLLALAAEKINRVHMLPSFALALTREKKPPRPPAQSCWVLTGETLTVAVADRVARAFPEVVLYNTYGTTEAGECDSWYELPPEITGSTVPVGAAPVGVTLGLEGEVLLHGPGLSRGYYGNPRLTADRFRPCPWSGPGARMYRTGDLGRWSGHGELYLEGRRDRQLKVRGVLVDPEEVAAVLQEHPQVGEVQVLHGGRGLVAYHTGSAPVPELRALVGRRLPPQAVPVDWVCLSTFPRLPGGKVDLASLEGERSGASGRVASSPLWDLFQSVLGRRQLKPEDDFFEVGGDSLLAVRLFQRIEELCGQRLPLATLIQSPRLGDLAALIERQPRPSGPLVAMGGAGRRPPLYLVHPRGGGVLCYRELVRQLGADCPVYAFECSQTEGRTVADLSQQYLRVLLQHQPLGPYRLAGYSWGGWIAFDMACRLHQEGRNVEWVGLLDSYGPDYRCRLSVPALIWAHLVAAPRRGWLFLRIAAGLPGRRFEYLKQRWRETTLLYREHFSRLLGRGPAMNVSQHALSYYPGKVTLFRTSLQEPGLPDWPCSGWSRVARQVEIMELEGTHSDLLRWPTVERLAARLRQILDQLSL